VQLGQRWRHSDRWLCDDTDDPPRIKVFRCSAVVSFSKGAKVPGGITVLKLIGIPLNVKLARSNATEAE
jgi:hypothetical protein